MAKKSGKAAIPNWKKKKWYELVAPEIYSEKVVGESLVEAPENLVGKVVSVNLMNLIGSPRKQSFSVKLRVEKVQGNKGFTKPIRLSMLPSSVRRLIRAGKNRIDMSFTVTSKDDVLIRLKPLIVTKSRAPNSTLTDLRASAEEFLGNFAKNNGYEAMFDAATRATLQRELKDTLEKVYPLRLVEMRVLEVELFKGERVLPAFVPSAKEEKVEEAPVKEEAVEEKVEEAPVKEEAVEEKVEEAPAKVEEEVTEATEDAEADSEDDKEDKKE